MRTFILFALALAGTASFSADASAGCRKKKKAACEPVCCPAPAPTCGHYAPAPACGSSGYTAAPACGSYGYAPAPAYSGYAPAAVYAGGCR